MLLSKIERVKYGANILKVFDEKVTLQESVWEDFLI